MAKTAKIEVKDEDFLAAMVDFFKSLLAYDNISALLVPQHLPMKNVVMPTLVTDPGRLDNADPLAPVFPVSAAKLVSRLTRKPMGGTVAAVMRSCEIRAFIELVKLKQGCTDDLIIIGVDCLGTYKSSDYLNLAGENGRTMSLEFCRNALSGANTPFKGMEMATTCRACEFPVPSGADIIVGLFGVDVKRELLLQFQTPKGESIADALGLSPAEAPSTREDVVASVKAERTAYRDRMFAQTAESVNSLEKLTQYLAGCINCYNCRVACPVCYCKECVFVTDVFDHEPYQYLRWADRKGLLKMPTDTVFYHITRLAHMSTACVGCGQCSNVCPKNIPVMELFRTVSHHTQHSFEYQAGRSLEEAPPQAVFREDEFPELTGDKN